MNILNIKIKVGSELLFHYLLKIKIVWFNFISTYELYSNHNSAYIFYYFFLIISFESIKHKIVFCKNKNTNLCPEDRKWTKY
jgi:hypothetical protein